MKKESGFSLAEMMVLLLVIAITAAASAPLITTKLHGVAGNNPPWVYSNGDSITYNSKGGNISAVIGATHAPKFNGKKARLHIDAKDKSMSHILMREDNDLVKFRASNDSVVLSDGFFDYTDYKYDSSIDLNLIKKSLILGPNIAFNEKDNTNNVVVGKHFTDHSSVTQNSTVLTSDMVSIPAANQTNKNSLCIANAADYFGDNSVVIGLNPVNGSYGESSNGTVLIGSSPGYNGGKVLIAGPIVRHNKSIGLGEYAEASGNNTIAIGYYPAATVDYGIAIGKKARVEGEKSIAIGQAKLYKTETINGKETTTIANNTVAISGIDRKIKASNTVALGGGDANDNSVIIGYTSTTKSTDCIQIGSLTSIDEASPYSIAIGRGAEVGYYEDLGTGNNNDKTYYEEMGVDCFVKDKNHYYWGGKNVVIGNNSKANSNRSTVIGANVELEGGGENGQIPRQIVLGTAGSTVYIPGKLVVRGDTYLAYGNEEQTDTPYVFIGVAQKNKTNWTHRRVIKEDTGTEEYRTLRVHKDTGREFDVGSDPLSSDRRLKNVGEAFKAGLDEIKKLEVFHYTFKKDPNQTPRVGVMAQDLQKIFPEAVFKGEDGFLRIRMEDMFYTIVNAIKELDSIITAQADKMNILAKSNKNSYKRLAKIEKRIAKLEKKELKANKKRLKNEDK